MKKFTVQKDSLHEGENVFHKHQTKIAKDTLRMHDAAVGIMGGMNKEEARTHLKKMGWSDERIHAHEHGEKPLQEQNGYIGLYKGRRVEVYADTIYAAQKAAAIKLGAKKHYDVSIHLAEKDGKPVVHSTASLGEAMSPIKAAEKHALDTVAKHGLDHPKVGVAMRKLNKLYNKRIDGNLKKSGLREEAEELNEIRLGITDHRVIKSFMNKKPLESKKLSTDGKSLRGNWIGGSGIAHHSEKGIHLNDTGSKSGQQIHHAIKKHNSYDSHSDVPHYELHEDVSLMEAVSVAEPGTAKARAILKKKKDHELERHLDLIQQQIKTAHAQKNTKALTRLQSMEGDVIHVRASRLEETATHKGPRWKYQDGRGVDQEGHVERYLDHGGTDHTAYLRRDDGTLDLVSGSRLKNAKVVHSK